MNLLLLILKTLSLISFNSLFLFQLLIIELYISLFRIICEISIKVYIIVIQTKNCYFSFVFYFIKLVYTIIK